VGPLAAAGTLPLADVAAPRPAGTAPLEGGPGPVPDGPALAARLEALLHLVDAPGAPALVRAAVVHAETASARPFTAGNAAVGRLLARHLVTRDGLEPTGVAVADLWASRAPGGYAQALAAYASGTGEGAVDWVLWQAEALLVGIEEGLRLCRAVQAGTTAAG
ncbi:Fic family protein, partial [Actinomyces sp. AC-20-1]